MLEIKIREIPGTMADEIFIYEMPDRAPGSVGAFYTLENGELISHQIIRDNGQYNIKPCLTCPSQFTRDFLQGFLNIARERGMKPSSESHFEGKLEATIKHLEDMRRIVFEPTITSVDSENK